MRTSVITGEQRIQKKGLGRCMCHCRSSARRPRTGPFITAGSKAPLASVPEWTGARIPTDAKEGPKTFEVS